MAINVVDTYLRKRFGLFEGRRKASEDKEIYEKIYEGMWSEVLIWLKEELGEEKSKLWQAAVVKKLGRFTDPRDKFVKSSEEIIRLMVTVPDFALKLEKRMMAYIDNAYVKAVRQVEGKE